MSKNKTILSQNPYIEYDEKAPTINALEFQKVIDSRRAVRIYENTPIPEDIVMKCLHNALLAPNSSNLQPWEIYWVKSPEKKKALVYACLNQIAAKTAAELFVIVARTDTWKTHAKEMLRIFSKAKNVPELAKKYYSQIVPFVYTLGPFSIFGFIKRFLFFVRGLKSPIIREPVQKSHLRLWAVKSTALAAENLMLSLRAYGFDSCPMEGYDSKRIKKLLGLGRNASVVMVISAGKRAQGGIYGERIRFSPDRFIKKI
ncbi:MAG: nitroreductase family protein [Spirochaetes bacterium]|nr:nitroreductase family protein [Spirochaetota bacterium]